VAFRSPGILAVHDGVVWVGPDAGLPRTTPLFSWKSGVSLAEVRALSEAVRREAQVELPEEERARLEADDREIEEALRDAGAVMPESLRWRDLSLPWREQARLLPITEKQAAVLTAHGAPSFEAGYQRVSEVLCVGRRGQPMDYVWRDEVSFRTPRYRRAFEATWADRVFRALTAEVVTEAAVSFAKRLNESHAWDERVVDEADAAAAHRAREAIEANENAVEIPRSGTAWRVVLPPFEVKLCRSPSRFAVPDDVRETRTIAEHVVWVLR
jgi:hypothetical protein